MGSRGRSAGGSPARTAGRRAACTTENASSILSAPPAPRPPVVVLIVLVFFVPTPPAAGPVVVLVVGTAPALRAVVLVQEVVGPLSPSALRPPLLFLPPLDRFADCHDDREDRRHQEREERTGDAE